MKDSQRKAMYSKLQGKYIISMQHHGLIGDIPDWMIVGKPNPVDPNKFLVTKKIQGEATPQQLWLNKDQIKLALKANGAKRVHDFKEPRKHLQPYLKGDVVFPRSVWDLHKNDDINQPKRSKNEIRKIKKIRNSGY